MQLITIEAVLMNNGEIICAGKTIGWENDLQRFIRTRHDAVTGKPLN